MFDFNVLKFFDINTRSDKVLHPPPIRWEFPSPGWVKINNDSVTRGYLGFAACGGILLVVSLLSLIFRLLWLLSFRELYRPFMKLKRWVLLVYDLNVILPWFVLHLLLWLRFLGFFIIGGTLAFISMGKSDVGFLTFFF